MTPLFTKVREKVIEAGITAIEKLITQADLESYERGVKETSLKHSEKIRQLLTQYANTPLKERKTGWDWLLKARNVVEEEYRTITNLPTN